ncbi:uncharacterized protein [Watersipora subatra]|uniref:uncharacterized protein n=1 Tax=Watersipora subatra TaxID=2589382 RepID=UPI00355C020C
MQYEWEKKQQGLFVIVRQTIHRLHFDPSLCRNQKTDWSKRHTLDYGSDETTIRETFNLLGKPRNLLRKENLTNTKGNDSFDKFMHEDVCGYGKDAENKPAFIMFFLMTHGFENGDFLLAEHGNKVLSRKKKTEYVSKKGCCAKHSRHRLTKKCFARNIVTDIVDKICGSFPEAEIPKIFVFQCCRGNLKGVEGQGHSLQPATSSTELFLPNRHDVFIFWASVEGYVSYAVKKLCKNKTSTASLWCKGSILIQSFCKSITELVRNSRSHRELVTKLQQQAGVDAQVIKEMTRLQEELMGGWIMNVCQRTTSLVANYLLLCGVIINDKTGIGRIIRNSSECLERDYKKNPELLKHRLINSLTHALDRLNLPKSNKHVVIQTSLAHPWPMLMYLWHNVQAFTRIKKLQIESLTEDEKARIENVLDTMIETIQKPSLSKQQPHISSSLSKKLSLIKILESQKII